MATESNHRCLSSHTNESLHYLSLRNLALLAHSLLVISESFSPRSITFPLCHQGCMILAVLGYHHINRDLELYGGLVVRGGGGAGCRQKYPPFLFSFYSCNHSFLVYFSFSSSFIVLTGL